MKYKEYLQSPEWRYLRKQALEWYRNQCDKCGNEYGLQVHHKRYPKVLGTETVSDLIVLCKICHQEEHGLRTPNSGRMVHVSEGIKYAFLQLAQNIEGVHHAK